MTVEAMPHQVAIPIEEWCPCCLGSGYVYSHVKGMSVEYPEECQVCHGTGSIRA